MHSWKEFDLTPKGIEDWISWYALTRENVMRCKDGSVLGMIRYQPFEKEQDEDPQEIALLTHLSKGWTLWIDDTFTGKETVHTLFLSWNPFYTMGGKTENGISGNVTKDDEVDQDLCAGFGKVQGMLSQGGKSDDTLLSSLYR